MVAIFANHLRGVADPFPPVPLLGQCAVDAGKPARNLTQLSVNDVQCLDDCMALSGFGHQGAESKKAVSTATCR